MAKEEKREKKTRDDIIMKARKEESENDNVNVNVH